MKPLDFVHWVIYSTAIYVIKRELGWSEETAATWLLVLYYAYEHDKIDLRDHLLTQLIDLIKSDGGGE